MDCRITLKSIFETYDLKSGIVNTVRMSQKASLQTISFSKLLLKNIVLISYTDVYNN
jgi:hypothetical protein